MVYKRLVIISEEGLSLPFYRAQNACPECLFGLLI